MSTLGKFIRFSSGVAVAVLVGSRVGCIQFRSTQKSNVADIAQLNTTMTPVT